MYIYIYTRRSKETDTTGQFLETDLTNRKQMTTKTADYATADNLPNAQLGNCLQTNVVYKAEVTTTDNNETRT